MESNSYSTGLRVSGNISADCTLLITDIFDLFPSSFSKLIPLLEKKYRVITYSDNGFDIFNRTRQLRHQTMHSYANDLIKSLHEKKVRNVTYIAHSVNAFLAFHAAINEPGLFDKIVLLSAVPYLKQDAAMQYQCGFDMNTDKSLLFDYVLQSDTTDENSNTQLHSLLGRSFTNMNLDKARLIFNFLLATDCRNHLDKITVPVMILQSISDKIATSEAAFFMHRRIPDSYIIKIKAKGHLPQYNAPDEVFRAMEIFMYPAVC